MKVLTSSLSVLVVVGIVFVVIVRRALFYIGGVWAEGALHGIIFSRIG